MEANPDEKHASFCGRKTIEKFSYCPLHLMIVFQPKGKKKTRWLIKMMMFQSL